MGFFDKLFFYTVIPMAVLNTLVGLLRPGSIPVLFNADGSFAPANVISTLMVLMVPVIILVALDLTSSIGFFITFVMKLVIIAMLLFSIEIPLANILGFSPIIAFGLSLLHLGNITIGVGLCTNLASLFPLTSLPTDPTIALNILILMWGLIGGIICGFVMLIQGGGD